MTDEATVHRVVRRAVEQNLFDAEARWALFVDLDALETRFERILAAFPDDALHAVAVKANPLASILACLVERGAGLEAASWGEIELAKSINTPADRIVYDSPAKTRRELADALELGVWINADNLAEIERIASLNPDDDARVGLRINPLVGAGEIEETSVATRNSKFGEPLDDHSKRLVDAFRSHRWLRGVHVHTGSQGCGLELLAEGVRRCVQFADEIERHLGEHRIDVVDIGGGLPVAYREDDANYDVADYADKLREAVPELFTRDSRIVTEFGRWLFAPCGVAASRVEYVKQMPDGVLATIHFGADLMLRTAYQPENWYHSIDICDASGRRRRGDRTAVTVAGPLCFSGDVIARNRRLPRPRPDDLLVARDVGAYTFSMWSHYCSRPFPRVFGVRSGEKELSFELLHPGGSVESAASFWGADRS